MKLKNWIALNFEPMKQRFFTASLSSPREFCDLGTWNDKETQLVFDMSKIVIQKYMKTCRVIFGDYFLNYDFYYYLLKISHEWMNNN